MTCARGPGCEQIALQHRERRMLFFLQATPDFEEEDPHPSEEEVTGEAPLIWSLSVEFCIPAALAGCQLCTAA